MIVGEGCPRLQALQLKKEENSSDYFFGREIV
jgi:hypothetical protein